jgi:hypothetical protein
VDSSSYDESCREDPEGEEGSVCTSVCTSPLDEGELEAAIDRVTRALLTAGDDVIPELVAERRAMREELAAMREEDASVIRLNEGRRGPRR